MTEDTIKYEIPKYGDINRLYFTNNIDNIIKLMLKDNANGLCFIYIDTNNKYIHVFYGYKYMAFGKFKNNPINLLNKIQENPYYTIPPKELIAESNITKYIEGVFNKEDEESKPKIYFMIEDMVGKYTDISYKYENNKMIKLKNGVEVGIIKNNELLSKSYTNKDIPNMPELNGSHDPGDAKFFYLEKVGESENSENDTLDKIKDFLMYINMFRDIIPPIYDSIDKHINMLNSELIDIQKMASDVVKNTIRKNDDDSVLSKDDYIDFAKREFLDKLVDYIKNIDNDNITEKARTKIIDNLYKVKYPNFEIEYIKDSKNEIYSELDELKNKYKKNDIYKLYKKNGNVEPIVGEVIGELNNFKGDIYSFVYDCRNYVRDPIFDINDYIGDLQSCISFKELDVYSDSSVKLNEDYYQIKEEAFDGISKFINSLHDKVNNITNKIDTEFEDKSEYIDNMDIPDKNLGLLYNIDDKECDNIDDTYLKSICQNLDDYEADFDDFLNNLSKVSNATGGKYADYTFKYSDYLLSNGGNQSFKGNVVYTKLKNDITGYTTDVFEKPQESTPRDNKLIMLTSKQTIENNKHVIVFVEAKHNVDIGTPLWLFIDDTYPLDGVIGTGDFLYGYNIKYDESVTGISTPNEKIFWSFEIIYDYGVIYRLINKSGKLLHTRVANIPNEAIDEFLNNILLMYGSFWENNAFPYRNEFSFLCNVDIFSEYSGNNFEYSLDKYMKRKFETSPEIFFSNNISIEKLYADNEIVHVKAQAEKEIYLTEYNYNYNSLIIDCDETVIIHLCNPNDVKVSQNDFNFSLDIKFTNKVPNNLSFYNAKTLSIYRMDFSEAEISSNFQILHNNYFEIKETTFVFKNKEQFKFFLSKVSMEKSKYNLYGFTNCTFILKEENKTFTGTFVIDGYDDDTRLIKLKDSSFLQSFSFTDNIYKRLSYFSDNVFIDFEINNTESDFSASYFLDVFTLKYDSTNKTMSITMNGSTVVFNNVKKENRLILTKDVVTDNNAIIFNGERKDLNSWAYSFWINYNLSNYITIKKIAFLQNLTNMNRDWSMLRIEDSLILKPLQDKRLKEQEEFFDNPVDYCVDDML